MKKVIAIVFATGLFFMIPGYFASQPDAGTLVIVEPELISYETFTLDTLTVYNPTEDQCDADPFITASNKKINLDKLHRGSIRWMAISRNMLNRWGGQLQYGDTVELHAGDDAIDGVWIIQDTMNKRYKNRGDLLFHSRLKSFGLWTNVTLTKRKVYTIAEEGIS
ncbi:hypothetical protein [Chryseolinea sp. H1M3-3]|uniref:hypothetical protein n=1 Tax=Chryseolinea sp. H1M3-3 TaxID=3034144 RepID=UPI0023EBC956|nr:hypothetical protein [Chryseolinea sp. H1M3-3]